MPAPAKKERAPDPCPRCYLESNVYVPLEYKPGARFSHFCSRGHEYPEREELSSLMMQATAKIKAASAATKEPETTILVEGDKTVVEDGHVVQEPVVKTEVTIEAPPAYQDKSIHIGPVDFSRLSQIVGHFTDSSSLFGAVFALNQQLADTRELLTRAESAKQVSSMRKLSGDVQVTVMIPERHVGPLNDIATANGMDITRYLNSRIEDGLDNYWFY